MDGGNGTSQTDGAASAGTADAERIAALESQVAELTALVARLAPAAAAIGEVPEDLEGEPRSRRGLLKLAGAAVGAAALAVGSQAGSAAASDPNDITIGVTNSSAQKTTLNLVGPASGGVGLLVQSGNANVNGAAGFPAALGAWATIASHPTGLYAYTSAAVGSATAVTAIAEGALSIGVVTSGRRAPLRLMPNGTPPSARADAHAPGELVEDLGGDLWLCIVAGTPGTWRKVGGPASAGSLHAISPVRVFDSRSPLPAPGKLATGASRVLSVRDGRDQASGAVNAADVVPAGAVAVVGNITVTNTTGAGGGFLSIMPGDAASPVGSSINWFGVGQNLANSFTAKLDGARQLKVFCGGAPNPDTDVVVDITGYYL